MSKTILLCDDSMMARVMLQRVVETVCGPDDEIIIAENANQALEKTEGKTLSIAIIDYNMPGIDGLKLAKLLRHRQLGLPIALCSANIQNAIKDRAAALDITFIAKPISDDNVGAFVREHY